MSDYVLINGELYHHGVKGMKWGKRKARYDSEAKANYKSAKKAYNKAYNDAYNFSARHPISQWAGKKNKAESDRRWDDAFSKAGDLDKAKAEYKQAKSERKQRIKDVTKEINKKTSLGEKLIYNDAVRMKAAKYVVDNNMTMADATKKAKGEAKRNTAIYCGAYAALTVASLYARTR